MTERLFLLLDGFDGLLSVSIFSSLSRRLCIEFVDIGDKFFNDGVGVHAEKFRVILDETFGVNRTRQLVVFAGLYCLYVKSANTRALFNVFDG